MNYTENGRPIYKRLDVKVIVGDKTFPLHYRAASGKFYSQEEIDTELERIIDHIDKNFPKLEFRQVTIVPNRVNFIAIGKRKEHVERAMEKSSNPTESQE
jgi:hypothetical protein